METTRIGPLRVRLLGEPVDLVTPAEVIAFTARRISAGQRGLVANHNLHSLYLVRRDAEADLIELDSTPLIFWGRLTRKPLSRAHRCTYLDWREAFWLLAEDKRWRVFYLGGAPGVADLAMRRLRERHPRAILAGRDGYFDATPGSPDNAAVLAEINAFRPDVLFVGMGMPRQELWIARHYHRFERGVVFPVGAAFDYEAGVQTAAPRWLGQVGLEWAFRLASSPGRLAERYLIEPWSLIPAALRDLTQAYAPPSARSAKVEPALR
jgi:N-acetylglucosaminyldiphosphoundecaprenol N-acetyl-beta-D-mannosaminyltransferase